MSCANSQNEYTGDGLETGYLFTFEYEQQAEVQVEVLNTDTGEYEVKQQDDATYGWAFNGLAAITFTTAPADGVKFKIARNTIINPLQATFYPGSSIRAQDLNNNFEQLQRAIEDSNCDRETLKEYVDENYWDKLDDTLKSGEDWVADDDHIATNLRNDERYLKLAGPGANITTEAEQLAGTVPDDDTHVLSNAASIERHDNILSTADPGAQSQPGKLWMNTSTETQNYWNADIGAWIDTSGVGPQGPQGPQGPAATIEVGNTTTSAPGGDAVVTNTGTETEAVFNFTIPRGEQGPVGPEGPEGPQGSGVTFQGQLDPTLPGSAPANPAVGDVWLSETAGVVDASWGTPPAGETLDVGWRLIWNAQGTWTLAEPSVSEQLWELNAEGDVTTVLDRDVFLPADLLVGGTDAAPRLIIRGDNVIDGTGINSPTAQSLGFVANDVQQAVVNADGLSVGPSIQLQATNETILVGNMRIDTNQINHVGQWSIDINNNDLIVFRDNDITTIEDLDVEGLAAPGLSLNVTTGNTYRIDTVVAGAEVFWETVGAPNPQVGSYFTAIADAAVPANQEVTRILDTADLHVSGNASVGGGLTVNNITFPDGSVIEAAGAGATISPTPPNPGNEAEGDLWWNSDDGRLYIWYIDPNTDAQWVDASPDGGQFTTGPVAPPDPNEGDVWIDTSQCPPILLIWSDCSGTGEWSRDGGALIAPRLGAATLTNTNTGTGRFDDEDFTLAMQLETPGQPEATVGARVVIEPENLRIITRPTTDDITQVDTVEYAGGFNIVDVNDNGWYDITWFGPPWNFYYAYSTSGSGVSRARSYDGINWELFSCVIGATTNCRPVYVEKYQRIYWVARGYAVYWTDDPDLETFTTAIDFGGNSPNAEARINQIQYLPEQDFFVAYREHWTAPNIMRSAVGDGDLSSGWRTQGTVQGYCTGGTIVKPGTNQAMVIMNSYGPANENYQQTVYTADITASSISWQNPLNGQTAGTFPSRGGYYDTVADRWVMACSYPVTGTVSWDGNTTPTNANAEVTNHGIGWSRMEWIESAGFAIAVGGDSQQDNGKIWILTDGGRQIQEIITSVPYVYWSDVNCENGLFLFCANAGNDPGMRFAYSTTVGQTQQAPRLLLESDFGLNSFSVGQEVVQSDGNASGLVGEISVAGQTMTIANSTGTWAVGQQVVGPASEFTKAWGVIDADGNVTGLSPTETPYTTMNGDSPYTISFPATFADGTTPDEAIPAGNGIRIQGRALSEQDDFTAESRSTSNLVVPT